MKPFSRLTRRTRSRAIGTAYRAEVGITALLARLAIRRGWTNAVLPYSGIASGDDVRVLGRVVIAAPGAAPSEVRGVSGWRRLLTLEHPGAQVNVEFNGQRHQVEAGEGGMIDALVQQDLEPGRVRAHFEAPGREPVHAEIHVASREATIGVVCDIDDTAWVTGLRHPIRAAWRTLTKASSGRQAVPGVASLLRAALGSQQHPAVIYLSNGPWNLAGPVMRFLERNDFPAGVILMTDWGVQKDRWFRDGKAHKRGSLERLARDLPWVKWVLVGDDGEHDPVIYADFVRSHPGRVAAVALRQVTIDARGQTEPDQVDGVPFVRAPDGDKLRTALAEVFAGLPGR